MSASHPSKGEQPAIDIEQTEIKVNIFYCTIIVVSFFLVFCFFLVFTLLLYCVYNNDYGCMILYRISQARQIR